jgi:hypothetical protein
MRKATGSQTLLGGPGETVGMPDRGKAKWMQPSRITIGPLKCARGRLTLCSTEGRCSSSSAGAVLYPRVSTWPMNVLFAATTGSDTQHMKYDEYVACH